MVLPHAAVGIALAVSLGSCKLAERSEQNDRPLPTPEPASSVPVRPLESPTARQRERPRSTAPAPAAPRESEPAAPPPAREAPGSPATPAVDLDAGSPSPPPSATATAAPATDGGFGGPSVACLHACQTALTGCMGKPMPLDAGLPSLESMAECKRAFEECRDACAR